MSVESVPPDHSVEAVNAPAQEGSKAKSEATAASMPSTLNSMGQLRQEAPAVYKAILEGITFKIIRQMKEHASRLKEIIREQNRR